MLVKAGAGLEVCLTNNVISKDGAASRVATNGRQAFVVDSSSVGIAFAWR